MRRIKITVAYDGTNYHGWQLQKEAPTIERALNESLSLLFKEEIQVIGASRTDAGVHARGNVAVFDTNARIPAEKIWIAMNTKLPDDIRVVDSVEVPLDWHPRHQDCRKTYEYSICSGRLLLPTERLYSYFTYHKLDIEEMKKAASLIVGEHDYSCFCAAGSQAESMVRTVHSVKVEDNYNPANDMTDIKIYVTGNGFLYNMVRIIAGTLVDVGLGKIKAVEIPDIIASMDRRRAGRTLPANGLMLVGYEYEKNILDNSETLL